MVQLIKRTCIIIIDCFQIRRLVIISLQWFYHRLFFAVNCMISKIAINFVPRCHDAILFTVVWLVFIFAKTRSCTFWGHRLNMNSHLQKWQLNISTTTVLCFMWFLKELYLQQLMVSQGDKYLGLQAWSLHEAKISYPPCYSDLSAILSNKIQNCITLGYELSEWMVYLLQWQHNSNNSPVLHLISCIWSHQWLTLVTSTLLGKLGVCLKQRWQWPCQLFVATKPEPTTLVRGFRSVNWCSTSSNNITSSSSVPLPLCFSGFFVSEAIAGQPVLQVHWSANWESASSQDTMIWWCCQLFSETKSRPTLLRCMDSVNWWSTSNKNNMRSSSLDPLSLCFLHSLYLKPYHGPQTQRELQSKKPWY